LNVAIGTWLMPMAILLLLNVSLGIRVIQEVAWHDLKTYSLRRSRRDRFDTIHDEHDQVMLRLEAARTFCHLFVLIAAIDWMPETLDENSESIWILFLRLAVPLGIALLAATVWLPAAVERFWGTPILFHFWRMYRAISQLAVPLEVGTNLFVAMFSRLTPDQQEHDEEEAFEDEVLAIVTEGLHDGHLEAEAREMIEGVMELGDANVADIMTPRSKIDAYSIDVGWQKILAFATDVGRTRIPVYEGSLDNIIGILYVKDLLAELRNPPDGRSPLRELLREAWRVPLTRPLDDMLQDFLHTRNHLAIVVDEYSGVAGLVTIEDVLEEIVGEIVDESDEEHVGEIRQLSRNSAEIRGRAHLAEINDYLGIELPDSDDFETIAGLTVSSFGRIPAVGESFEMGSLRITVLESNRRRVERVQIDSDGPMVQESG
jgi:CBS domain containing-hemolysin-like protein